MPNFCPSHTVKGLSETSGKDAGKEPLSLPYDKKKTTTEKNNSKVK